MPLPPGSMIKMALGFAGEKHTLNAAIFERQFCNRGLGSGTAT